MKNAGERLGRRHQPRPSFSASSWATRPGRTWTSPGRRQAPRERGYFGKGRHGRRRAHPRGVPLGSRSLRSREGARSDPVPELTGVDALAQRDVLEAEMADRMWTNPPVRRSDGARRRPRRASPSPPRPGPSRRAGRARRRAGPHPARDGRRGRLGPGLVSGGHAGRTDARGAEEDAPRCCARSAASFAGRADQPTDARAQPRARRAASAIAAAEAPKPSAPTAASSSEVSAVTARTRGGGTEAFAAPRAAPSERGAEHRLPSRGVHGEVSSPRARRRAPRRSSTVFGMSCSLRSRKTARALSAEGLAPRPDHARRRATAPPSPPPPTGRGAATARAPRRAERPPPRRGARGPGSLRGELQVDDLLELVDRYRAVEEDAVDEEGRRAVHPGGRAGLAGPRPRLLLVTAARGTGRTLRRPARRSRRRP